MRHRKTVLAPDLIGGFVLSAGLLAAAYFLINTALVEQQAFGKRRLFLATQYLAQEAHRKKDDIALEEAVRAMAEVSAVRFAAVLDRNGVILAHSDPTLIGQRFTPDNADSVGSLKVNREVWGKLVFRLADASAQKALGRVVLILSVLTGLILAAFLGRMGCVNLRAQKLEDRIEDLESLLSEEIGRARRLSEHLERYQESCASNLRGVFNGVVSATLLLDATQRLVGFSKAAGSRFGEPLLAHSIGQSWTQLPYLRNYAAYLQQSLKAPGQATRWTIGTNAAEELVIETIMSERQNISGTLFTFLRAS